MSGAEDTEERAALWLIAREELDWTPAQEEEFQAWLSASDSHKVAYWRLEHGWRAADRIGAIGAAAKPTAGWREVGWRHRWVPHAIAASLLIVFGGIVMQTVELPFSSEPAERVARLETAVGDRKLINLSDGSRIELNTATVLRAELGSDRRAVWLDRGEAYFDIASHAGSPFVVYAGPRTITVIGTKFSVRRIGDELSVSVAEGRVRVDDLSAEKLTRSATLTTGDVAVADERSMLVAVKAEDQVEERFAWRRNMLLFDDTSLADAAAEFNRYNDRKLVIADEATARIRIGGSFQTKNVDGFVRLLHQAYGLDAAIKGNTVTISG